MTVFPSELRAEAEALLAACRRAGLRLATAESCTGGLLAACLTEIAGASDVFERGFITYSNAAKTDLLAVPQALIERHGAVSAEVAQAMAEGALGNAAADLAVAITGVAGPGGGSEDKPVGLVLLGIARLGRASGHERFVFAGDRTAIRLAAVKAALDLLTRAVA